MTNGFRDDAVKTFILYLVDCILSNCCCTVRLSLVNALVNSITIVLP